MYCRLRRGGGCDSRSDGSGELSGRRHTMQKIAYAASNRLPTLLKEEPEILSRFRQSRIRPVRTEHRLERRHDLHSRTRQMVLPLRYHRFLFPEDRRLESCHGENRGIHASALSTRLQGAWQSTGPDLSHRPRLRKHGILLQAPHQGITRPAIILPSGNAE